MNPEKRKEPLMRTTILLTLVLAALAVSGCAAVSSIEPVGERPKELIVDQWDGTWIHRNEAVTIKVLDMQKGLLRVAWVEEQNGIFKLESRDVELRESGEWIFGNVVEKQEPASYYWGLVQKDEGQIAVWLPDPAQFAKLVQTGSLPGKVEKENKVILEKLAPEQLKELLSGDKGSLLDWKRPVVFFRVGK
ncbi:MAG: hypothetical protein CVU64_21800 [Deltaproteobacteria bacterium HGW-Deltaproteobacteria-21]|nr:MAG: hypothetical protein CVU64_21800 [Deltaproteobacteria bacterium HGW-Deltaproteobacteria-21]